MIGVVYTGWNPGGLIAYLMGPGRYEEHVNPRVIAAWHGDPFALQPHRLAQHDGADIRELAQEGEFDLRELIEHMRYGVRAAGLPLHKPAADSPLAGREGYVFHMPVRLAPSDSVLADHQWKQIIERFARRLGFSDAGCRWIAVRHDDDHVHFMAVSVHRRRGQWRRYWPKFYKRVVREVCRELEAELGLVATAPADRTSAPHPTRGELAKSERTGVEPARVRLRRIVAQAAATTRTADGFAAKLAASAVAARFNYDAQGDVRGYAVALRTEPAGDGQLVFYSGGRLAPDLTWPKLLMKWAHTPPGVPPQRNAAGRVTPQARVDTIEQVNEAVEAATNAIATLDSTTTIQSDEADAITQAVGETFHALADTHTGHPREYRWVELAEAFDRATRTPHRVLVTHPAAHASYTLRQAARQLGSIAGLTGRGKERAATAVLVYSLASLVAEIAAAHQTRGRRHHLAAAQRTGHLAHRQLAETPQQLPADSVRSGKRQPVDARPAPHLLKPTSEQPGSRSQRRQHTSEQRRTSPKRRP